MMYFFTFTTTYAIFFRYVSNIEINLCFAMKPESPITVSVENVKQSSESLLTSLNVATSKNVSPDTTISLNSTPVLCSITENPNSWSSLLRSRLQKSKDASTSPSEEAVKFVKYYHATKENYKTSPIPSPKLIQAIQNEKNYSENEISFNQKRHPDKTSTQNTLYEQLPPENDVLACKLYDEARFKFIEEMEQKKTLSAEHSAKLFVLLQNTFTPPNSEPEPYLKQKQLPNMINYRAFRNIARELLKLPNGEVFNQFFTPSIFLKIYQDDAYGRISAFDFYRFVTKKDWYTKIRCNIMPYDVNNQGYLTRDNLDQYIEAVIFTLPNLCMFFQDDPTTFKFYKVHVAKKFTFFLDPLNTGRIKITDIIASGMLEELDRFDQGENKDESFSLDAEMQESWFYPPVFYNMVFRAGCVCDIFLVMNKCIFGGFVCIFYRDILAE